MKNIKTYKLNEEQSNLYDKVMADGLNNGLSDLKADKIAFDELCKQYPHIKKFDKIK
jgi:hypothetical protein